MTLTPSEYKQYKDDFEDRLLRRGTEESGADFAKACKFLSEHNTLFENMMMHKGFSYLAALYLMRSSIMDNQTDSYEPKNSKNKDTDKISSYYRYMTTSLDLSADTFKEAINQLNYTKDECFINSIYDFYYDNLLRPDKKETS